MPPVGVNLPAGFAGFIVNTRMFEELSFGLSTATLAFPAEEMSLASIVAESCEEEMSVVARPFPFHITTAPGTKLLPLTVSVN